MGYVLGIEFGSTRIKSVLIDDKYEIVASGAFNWENTLKDNRIWTYSLDDATRGLQTCYKELKENYYKKFNKKLTDIDSIGISGMMHGYLVFDKNGKQLAEFRTWRNTITEQASKELTSKFNFHVPQRWSIAHLYQAILNKEKEVKDIAFMTTLAGYYHYLLSNKKVIGIGEASGVFPIDTNTNDYDASMLKIFNELVKDEVNYKAEDVLPKVLVAGQDAGHLTKEGALLIDPEGDLKEGIPMCPPEGDMGTGMIATNSVLKNTGNASIGTSSNLTIITNKKIGVYEEIDPILTPDGVNAALVHVNNGTSEMNVIERLFKEVLEKANCNISNGELYTLMFKEAMNKNSKVHDIVSVDYHSGEPITKVNEGIPLTIRLNNAPYDLANFVRMHIYSLLATIRLGIDKLYNEEGISVSKITGHGGFFTTKNVGDVLLASSLGCKVETLSSAAEGGPYGMAILASYLVNNKDNESLSDFLVNKAFKNATRTIVDSDDFFNKEFDEFLINYKKAIKVEKESINVYKSYAYEEKINKLKEDVYKANLRLKEEGLITLTWGNVSKYDRELNLIAIKPSGVSYDTMTKDDIVLVTLDGNVVDSKLKPSSDTKTHLEIYKNFKDVNSVVHTHSTFAVAFAQARKEIVPLGTTHADTFYGNVPLTRVLTDKEVNEDYELNTGKVIVERFKDVDPLSVPGVLVSGHGPFTFGKDEIKSVDNAVILEEVAKMSYLTSNINSNPDKLEKYILEKHYNRKHGKNAYYGQKGE